MTDSGDIRPYADAAWAYRQAGWQGVIPVGRGPAQKSPPATGYTGWAGLDPSGPDIQAWIDGPEGARNIGLHIPVGTYGLDVDDRHGGAASLAAILKRVGVNLPAGPTCTARGPDQPSRHHYFRAELPEGRVWLDHPGGKESGLDSLHVGHRYAVTWPSINPEVTDADGNPAVYEWYDNDGILYEGVFGPDDMPELPAELIMEFSKPGQPMEGDATGTADTLAAVRRYRTGIACSQVTKLLNDELDRIGKASSLALHDPGSLHPLVAYGIEGHVGVAQALSIHQAAYVAARVAHRGQGTESASADWWRQVCGSVGKTLHKYKGIIADTCGCGQAPRAESSVPQPEAIDPDEVPAPPTHDEAKELLADAGPGADTVRAAARDIARRVAAHTGDPAALNGWKDLLKSFGRLPNGEYKEIVKAVRDGIAARDEATLHARHEHDRAAAEEKGVTLPRPTAPLAVAQKLVARRPGTDGIPHDAAWRGDLYQWTGTHWRVVEESAVRRWIYKATEHAVYDAGPVRGMVPWDPDPASVNGVLDALATAVVQRDPSKEPDSGIALENGVYDLEAGELLPHHPSRFNLTSVPYAYDPDATCPQWEKFLTEVIPDPDGRAFLQEWAGYLLSGRTHLEKIAVLVGATRSGKGTVGRVLRNLLGEAWVATPRLDSLGEHFGKQPLIGRLLATFADVDWSKKGARDTVEDLLTLSGEDHPNVPRKGMLDWQGKLPVRLMMLSNDMPNLPNNSGALAGRMIIVRFGRSFLGQEDTGLTARLLTELPGVLLWAIEGLRRLNAAGRFTEPGGGDARTLTAEAGSPVIEFVEATCTVIPGMDDSNLDDVYERFRNWWIFEGKEDDRTRPRPDKATFSKMLQSAYGDRGVETRRIMRGGVRTQKILNLECHWTDRVASRHERH